MDDFAHKTMLIVEDDEGTQLLLLALMRRIALEPVVAPNGQEAIASLKQRTFDVIILDLMMPHASGYEVIAFLESEKRRERVIVCTAAGPRSTAGIDSPVVTAIIRKPFDIEALTSLVTDALRDSDT